MGNEEKIAMHHCAACYHVTLATLGKVDVVCEGCGTVIVETEAALAVFRTWLSEREATFLRQMGQE